MKTLYRVLVLMLAASLFAACSTTPTPPQTFPAVSATQSDSVSEPSPTPTLPLYTVQPLPIDNVTEPPSTKEPSPTPMPAPDDLGQYAPQNGDASLMRGDLRIVSASVSLTKSQPPQVILDMTYFKTTPCFQLRMEVNGPDGQGNIQVSAYAVAENRACTLMALATPLHSSLNLGSFPLGHYNLWLNGMKVGEFDMG